MMPSTGHPCKTPLVCNPYHFEIMCAVISRTVFGVHFVARFISRASGKHCVGHSGGCGRVLADCLISAVPKRLMEVGTKMSPDSLPAKARV